MFGLEFSWIDWTAISASIIGAFATIKQVIKAVRLGSQTVKTFAMTKVNNAQVEVNDKIDGLQLHFENKANMLESRLLQREQQIEDLKQEFIDYKNSIRSILDNA